MQANITEAEVSIPAKLHNSLIGTKGRLIRAIMEECGGVHIHFPVEGSGSDTVVIRGPSSDVEKAKRQLLHLAEEKVSAGGGHCVRPPGAPPRPPRGAQPQAPFLLGRPRGFSLLLRLPFRPRPRAFRGQQRKFAVWLISFVGFFSKV